MDRTGQGRRQEMPALVMFIRGGRGSRRQVSHRQQGGNEGGSAGTGGQLGSGQGHPTLGDSSDARKYLQYLQYLQYGVSVLCTEVRLDLTGSRPKPNTVLYI